MIAWVIVYDIPSRKKRLSREEYELIHDGLIPESNAINERGSIKWLALFTFPQTWAYITGKLLLDPIYWFFLFWLPSYFNSIFKLNMSRLSPELMIIYTMTIVGSIGGGYFS